MSLEPANGLCTGFLVGEDHLTQNLGIEPTGKLGRAHQIDEHYGELAPLGLACGGVDRYRP